MSDVVQTKSRDTQRLLDSIKAPPQSIEAEQSVLGGIMIDDNVWDAVSERLSKEDFYRHK